MRSGLYAVDRGVFVTEKIVMTRTGETKRKQVKAQRPRRVHCQRAGLRAFVNEMNGGVAPRL